MYVCKSGSDVGSVSSGRVRCLVTNAAPHFPLRSNSKSAPFPGSLYGNLLKRWEDCLTGGAHRVVNFSVSEGFPSFRMVLLRRQPARHGVWVTGVPTHNSLNPSGISTPGCRSPNGEPAENSNSNRPSQMRPTSPILTGGHPSAGEGFLGIAMRLQAPGCNPPQSANATLP